MDEQDSHRYWSVSESEILKALQTTVAGLTDHEARSRYALSSTSALKNDRRSSFAILASQFNNPIIWLLFVSAVLSYFLDDATNAEIIIVILVLSSLLSFWQERSAADAVAKLLAFIETKVIVRRAGEDISVPISRVVVGDIVLLRAGSVAPGDCRLLESKDLYVDESALTGESFPIEKIVGTLVDSPPISRRTNSVFLGTHIVSGNGIAVVARTGTQTEFGRISARLAPKSGFELGLYSFGKLLLGITLVLVLVVFLVNIFFQRPTVESLLFALALAVGMTPQLLPAITSVVLASGAKTMARSSVIVKRLLAIENFGGMGILCLDKTGTLTEGTVTLNSALDVGGQESPTVIRLAYLNASFQSSFENPIDRAILEHDRVDVGNVVKLDELPYDFVRRRMSVLLKDGTENRMITKGALANVLQVCTSAQFADGKVVAMHQVQTDLNRIFSNLSDQGLRVLGVACRTVQSAILDKNDERDMIFLGFLVFSDPLKKDISKTMEKLRSLGVRLKIITGDNRIVAASVGRAVGLLSDQILTGGEIHRLSDAELSQKAEQVDIFAEVEPDQKEKIILSLKRSGHIVGFLGDGINDAPALHSADVGISVASAVDVAREAAQVVLLKQDLNVLIEGVCEGRRTLANTLKYVFVSISANFGYMLSIAISSLFLPFLPLLPTQILLINLLADFPAMSLATDSVDAELIERPRRWDVESILKFMLMFGLMGTCSDLLTFAVMIHVFHVSEEEFRTGWFIVSIMTGLMIMLAVRTKRPFFASKPGRLLLIAVSSVAIITVALPFTRFGKMFELVEPSAGMLLMTAVITGTYAVMIEFGKRIFYRKIETSSAKVCD
jgi:P-type Mg2+ transporter